MNQLSLLFIFAMSLASGNALGDDQTEVSDILSDAPMTSTDSWALMELEKGRLLCASNAHQPREIASLTKIMNARIVLDLAAANIGYLDRTVVVSAMAASMIGTSSKLQSGDRLTVRDLLYGMLLPSGNDAAVALAEYAGRHLDDHEGAGNLERFVSAMNRKAELLGLNNTRFLDVHGLGENVSTPADVLQLSLVTLQEPLFRDIVSTREMTVPVYSARGVNRNVTWRNTNKLLHRFSGVKTGHTNSAGGALVLLGELTGREYLVAVLGASNQSTRFTDAFNLFHWFSHRMALQSMPVFCADPWIAIDE